MYLQAWNKLPFAKQMQICKQYGIKNHGTTEMQLDFELSIKLPVGFLPTDIKDELVKTEEMPKIESKTVEQVESQEESVSTQPEPILEPIKPKRGRKAKK